MEILCFATDQHADVLYFTPISAPYRQAIAEIATRRFAGVRLDTSVLGGWVPLLARATPHLLHEEGTFGALFW